jgi:hypothetical protein
MDGATIQTIVTAIAGLLTTILTVVVFPLVKNQLEIQARKLDSQAADALAPALLNAIKWAEGQVTGDEAAKLAAMTAGKDHLLSLAAGYVRRSVPDSLERLGIEDARLKELLDARLTDAINYFRERLAPKPAA